MPPDKPTALEEGGGGSELLAGAASPINRRAVRPQAKIQPTLVLVSHHQCSNRPTCLLPGTSGGPSVKWFSQDGSYHPGVGRAGSSEGSGRAPPPPPPAPSPSPASRGTCTPCPLASSAFKTSQSSSAPSQVTLCPPAPVCLPQAPSDYTGPFLMIQGSHTSRVSWPEILIPSATLIPLCPVAIYFPAARVRTHTYLEVLLCLPH